MTTDKDAMSILRTHNKSFTPMEARGTLVYLGRSGGFDVRDCPESESLAQFIVAACNLAATAPVAAIQPAGEMTMSYVQNVPDRCDRIVWRGAYYLLPLAPAASVQHDASARTAISTVRADSRDLVAICSFLLGEAPLEEVWFSDKHPDHNEGSFWWRRNLRAALATREAKAAISDEEAFQMAVDAGRKDTFKFRVPGTSRSHKVECAVLEMADAGKLLRSLASEAKADAAPVVPDGWQIVPKVLRQEMDAAMDRARVNYGAVCVSNQGLWDDALAAAPTPPATVSNTTAGAACSACYGTGYGVDGKPCPCGCRAPAVGMVAAPDLGEVWRVIDAAMPTLAEYHCPALHALSKGDKEIFARAILTAAPDLSVRDAARYAKLRRWMSSNVPEGWSEVEKLGALACYTDWSEFDRYLDSLTECNVGLCHRSAAPSTDTGAKS